MAESDHSARAQFEQQADRPQPGLLAEFWAFLTHHKKWWLLPILIVLGLLGVFVLLTASPLAPFIYPLF